MQFMPATWEAFGEGGDITDEADAIAAAGRFLVAAGAPDDLPRAVRHYNPSDAYVASVLGYHGVLETAPWMYGGFHDWQVYVGTTAGVLWLPDGYESPVRVPVEEYLASRS